MPAAPDLDPRIERSRELVLSAAADLLRDVGYGALTIEAVAARSGVAKSTIYRQWSGKAQMVVDAFERAGGQDAPLVPPPGPVRDRVVALLRTLIGDLGSNHGLACMMPALIDAAERSDEIAALTRRITEGKSARVRAVLDQAVEAGELAPDTRTTVLADALVGPIILRRVFHRDPVEVDDVPALVDQILPVVAPEPGRVSP